MSCLEKLIADLCPDGVEYRKIGEVVSYEQPTKYIVTSTDYDDTFPTPVLTPGKTFILGYTDETDGIYFAEKDEPVIIFDDFTGAFKWVDFPFKVKSSAMKMLKADETVTTLRYIYHVMGFINYSPSDHKRLWISTYSEFLIPLPPLPVQREIVRLLDIFTDLTAELSAELDARKKQNEYYRAELLRADVLRVSLKDLALRSYTGVTPLKSKPEFYDNGSIPWLRTQEVVFNEIWQTQCFITEEAVKKTSAKWVPANCVVVAISGATAGRCAINKIPLTTNQHCLCIDIDGNKALYKYVYYCVCNQHNELLAKKDGARGDLNVSKILSLKIPLPSIDVQERIVSILNRFEKLCNEISAEIEAREKQYEYYRNILFTILERNT